MIMLSSEKRCEHCGRGFCPNAAFQAAFSRRTGYPADVFCNDVCIGCAERAVKHQTAGVLFTACPGCGRTADYLQTRAETEALLDRMDPELCFGFFDLGDDLCTDCAVQQMKERLCTDDEAGS